LVAGNVVGMSALGTAMPLGTNNLFQGTADYHSWGVMLKTPSFFIIPSLTLAAQNTGAGLNPAGLGGNTAASGASIQTDFNLFGLPTLTAEYSIGKFGPGGNQEIWNTSAPISHEQLAIMTKVKF
ncbi:MAG: hypothetical protein ACK4N5_09610, partial [Myxococcales bacterium]